MGAFFDEGFVKGRVALLAGPARSDGGGRKAQKREETVDFGRDRPGVAGGARSGGEVADRAVGKSRARRSHERRRRPRICPLVRQDGLEIAWKGPALCAQTSDEGSIRLDERGAERAGRDLHVLDDGEEIRIRDRVEKAEGVRPVRRNSELRRQTGRSDGRRQAGPAHRRHRAVPLSGPREIGTDETLGENGHRSRAEMLEGILGGRERSSSVDDEAVGHDEKIERQVRIEGRDRRDRRKLERLPLDEIPEERGRIFVQRPEKLDAPEPAAEAVREVAKVFQAEPGILRLEQRSDAFEDHPEATLELVFFEYGLSEPADFRASSAPVRVVDPLDGLKGDGLRLQLQPDPKDLLDG
ncbi:MAG: hypothetical protein DMF54_08540 [Acidobacteria bacterium]|nr:MAG: hypothetical protein DMF54_08540 [Acidobacteriota bacterium]